LDGVNKPDPVQPITQRKNAVRVFAKRISSAHVLQAFVFSFLILLFFSPGFGMHPSLMFFLPNFRAQPTGLFLSSDPMSFPHGELISRTCGLETDCRNHSPDQTAPAQHHPRSIDRIKERRKMVEIIRDFYGLKDKKVLKAMTDVPRHWFVPRISQQMAYTDNALPIGHGQTISQPFIVAYMTSLLRLDENKKVLEVGTGSGYQAAVLSELTPHVYTIEILKPLAERAVQTFREKGYTAIKTKIGDGYIGWSRYQPYDAIIVTCAPDHIPSDLLRQLKPGGRMIIPVGSAYSIQELVLVTKDKRGRILKKNMMPVRFVPLVRKKNN